jgi:hypothetical protein
VPVEGALCPVPIVWLGPPGPADMAQEVLAQGACPQHQVVVLTKIPHIEETGETQGRNRLQDPWDLENPGMLSSTPLQHLDFHCETSILILRMHSLNPQPLSNTLQYGFP